jgi:hypothetical protein
VARSAERHLGMTYVRRTPLEQCRWRGAAQTRAPVGWSRDSAYVVGLIATDGCLIERPRRIDFVSSDRQLMETYLSCLGRPARYRVDRTLRGSELYRSAVKDAALYRWLLEIGLTPRKSLTLGALSVPDQYLPDLVRGLLDGDGSITNSTTAADTTRRPDGSYRYEWFRVQFASASRPHLAWLQGRIQGQLGVSGRISGSKTWSGGWLYQLRFGRWESMRLASWIYADLEAPCLIRKRSVWDNYAARYPDAVALAKTGMSPVARAAHARWARRDSNPHALTSTAP